MQYHLDQRIVFDRSQHIAGNWRHATFDTLQHFVLGGDVGLEGTARFVDQRSRDATGFFLVDFWQCFGTFYFVIFATGRVGEALHFRRADKSAMRADRNGADFYAKFF